MLGIRFIDGGLWLSGDGQIHERCLGQGLDLVGECLQAFVYRPVLFRKALVEFDDFYALVLREGAVIAVFFQDAVECSDGLVGVHPDGSDLV